MNEKVATIKNAIMAILQAYSIKRAGIFGSVVRGEDSDTSDVDIIVEFEGKKSLLDLAGLKIDLEEQLKRKVDVVTYNSLYPLLRQRILSEQEVIL